MINKKSKLTNNWFLFLGLILSATGCTEEVSFFPKPNGFPRIDLPKTKDWKVYQSDDCPYQYQYPSYAIPVDDQNSCNQSLHYPQFKATLYATYIPLNEKKEDQTLFFHSEYSRNLAYEHSIKADEISEDVYQNDSNQVYGVLYDIKGNVATNYQFYITDSLNHFYRGSLYFEASPNIDSIKPVLDFLKEDIKQMINTFKWK